MVERLMATLNERWQIHLDLSAHPYAHVLLQAIAPEDHIHLNDSHVILDEEARVDLRAMWNSVCRSLQASESTALVLREG